MKRLRSCGRREGRRARVRQPREGHRGGDRHDRHRGGHGQRAAHGRPRRQALERVGLAGAPRARGRVRVCVRVRMVASTCAPTRHGLDGLQSPARFKGLPQVDY